MHNDRQNWILSDGDGGTLVRLCVSPGAKQTAPAGISEHGLRLRLNAPATEGKANRELIRVLAKLLSVSKSRLALIRGHRSKDKTIQIDHMEPSVVLERLREQLDFKV